MLPEHLILGRGSSCDIEIRDRKVSSEHALMRWVEHRWRIMDLGSRNGTWIDGRRLDSGHYAELNVGVRLSFGSPRETWNLQSADAPVPFVRGSDGDMSIERGQIALPRGGPADLLVWRQDDGSWLAEHEGGQRVVRDRDVLDVGGRWRFYLPSDALRTEAASGNGSIGVSALVIRHDCTEEYVQVHLRRPSGVLLELGARAHHAVLLELGRVRLEDRGRGLASELEG
ncbi:MAG: FHA domain-containing protein [Myxococcales bacterium]|nr:FHA domain-containing protein [Myxococcales bacterium]